jgi:hypothetical protein
MPVDPGQIIDLLYVRGAFVASHVAAELGDDIEVIDVSVQMTELKRERLVEDEHSSPPRWTLTEAGNEVGRRRKARESG